MRERITLVLLRHLIHRHRYLTISVFSALFICGPIQSSELNTAETQRFVFDVMKENGVPGMAIVAFDQSGTTFEGAFGVADSIGTPVTLETPFQLGSVSKSFASLRLVQLVQENRVKLDAPISNYLLDLTAETRPVEWSNITVRHLLSHTSGLSMLDGNRHQRTRDRRPDAIQRVAASFVETDLLAAPGQRFEYSNANYILAAAIIEQVDGRAYEESIAEHIFGPLDMSDSFVQIPDATVAKLSGRLENPEAKGFVQWYGQPIERHFVAGRAMAGPGGVTASARDMARYLKAVIELSPNILKDRDDGGLTIPQTHQNEGSPSYGLGWMITENAGAKRVFHSGLNGGFYAHAAFVPDTGEGVVVLSNLSGSQVADVPGVVARKLLGAPTGALKRTWTQVAIVWVVSVGALFFSFGFSLSAKRLFDQNERAGQPNCCLISSF